MAVHTAEPSRNGGLRPEAAHGRRPRRRVRVLIAEDNASVRATLVKLLQQEPTIDLVGVAKDAPTAVDLARRLEPDVAVLDVKMPGGGGYRATREILASRSSTKVMALSAYQDRATVLEMVRSGALGYALKGDPVGEIVAAIHRTASGTGVLAPQVTGGVLGTLAKRLTREEHASSYFERVERRVRHVLEDGGPDVVFQPIVDLSSGDVAGFEALARFPAPPRGPEAWFNDAESVDLRPELEIAALRRATTERAHLPEASYLSVNVSPDVVTSDGCLETLLGVPAGRLVVEITEHACVRDYGEAATAIEPLRDHGARLAVDDAGAGFSSFTHILQLSPDIVKLDIGITRGVDSDPARRALASGLVSFAEETGAQLIAEGIETDGELRTLRDLGVGYGQGFGLARPVAATGADPVPRRVPV